MESQSSEVVRYLESPNLLNNNYETQSSMSLMTKLRNIERCIENKEFSSSLNLIRKLIKESKNKKQALTKTDIVAENNVESIYFGGLQIEKKIGKVILNKQVVGLSTNEFSLLMMLVERPNEVIDREKLHKTLLKTEYDGLNRSIDNTVSRLRKKLGDENISQLKIKSIRGKGYLFSTDKW